MKVSSWNVEPEVGLRPLGCGGPSVFGQSLQICDALGDALFLLKWKTENTREVQKCHIKGAFTGKTGGRRKRTELNPRACHTHLLRTDAADHTLLHPIDHVLLLHPAVEVLQSDLVVQAPLHFIGHHV